MSSYTIEIKGLDKLNAALKKSPQIVVSELKQGVKTSVNIIRPIMVRNAPAKTAKLRMNIYARVSGLTGEVGPNLSITPYALFVHKGTKSYIIRPRIKKALFWPGARHPVKMVRHPGIKPNPFVERTVKEIENPINMIFQNHIRNILTKFTN